MVRIAVIVTARPSWSKLATVCEALYKRPDVDLQIIACASALLERYGAVVNVIKQSFPVAAEVWSVYEGENLVTATKETGALLNELAAVLSRLSPDAVVICADRHEILAAAQASSYLHLPLVHLQGGERTGSIDDRVRDAVTQLADYHCVCTARALMRVYALTGAMDRIVLTGCSSIDVAKRAQSEPPVTAEELGGSGAPIDLRDPFLVLLQHPVTNEMADAGEQMRLTLEATFQSGLPTIAMWPGEDAGAGAMSKVIRSHGGHCHTLRNLPPNRFLRLLTQARCFVGNSSAGIRECAYLGVPVVNIGSRQQGRERGPNVRDVPHNVTAILDAIQTQAVVGRYLPSDIYGSGNAGERIAEVLCSLTTSAATA